MSATIRTCVALLAALTMWGAGAPAYAQTGGTPQTISERLHQNAVKLGNKAYNDGDYPTAISAYVEAIQSGPAQARPYRNLARAYFWNGDYAASVEYYDHYLRLANEDVDRVKAERRLAADRAGERIYTPPDSQLRAYAALESELEGGRAYTTGGGGAWGLYQTLMRTGYAEPQLLKVRSDLVRRLIDEFEVTLVPRAGQLTPRLDLDGWQLQAARLDAASRVADDPVMVDVIKRRSAISEAAIAMLTSQWDSAAELFADARETNPDMAFLEWFELTTLVSAGKYETAVTRLDELEKQLTTSGAEDRVDYVRILRASALQRLGRDSDAARLYYEVLRH